MVIYLGDFLCLLLKFFEGLRRHNHFLHKKPQPLTYSYTVLQRGIALREILRRESKTALERIPR